MRISSKKRFTHGLFLADFKHMPRGTCGCCESILLFLYCLREGGVCFKVWVLNSSRFCRVRFELARRTVLIDMHFI